jgi:hypothetical protein
LQILHVSSVDQHHLKVGVLEQVALTILKRCGLMSYKCNPGPPPAGAVLGDLLRSRGDLKGVGLIVEDIPPCR